MIFERFSAAKDQEVHRISSHLVGTGHNAAALPHFNSTSARVQNVRARHYRHPVRRAGQCNSRHPAHTDRLAREFCHVSGAGFQNAFYTAIVLAPDTISGFPQCINIFRNRRHMALWHTDGTARSRTARHAEQQHRRTKNHCKLFQVFHVRPPVFTGYLPMLSPGRYRLRFASARKHGAYSESTVYPF